MTSTDLSSIDRWTECTPGTLSQLSRQIRYEHRKQAVLQIAAPVMLALLMGFGVWSLRSQMAPTEFKPGGIACNEVQAQMQSLMQGKLDADSRKAIETHLAACERCQQLWKSMQNKTANDTADANAADTYAADSQNSTASLVAASLSFANLSESSISHRPEIRLLVN